MVVRANRSCVATHNGVPISIIEGTAYEDDDEIVLKWPWLFGDDPPVEEATSNPGRKRQR